MSLWVVDSAGQVERSDMDETEATPEKLSAFDIQELMAEIKVAAGEADAAEAEAIKAREAHTGATTKAQELVRKLLGAAVA